MTIRPIDLQLLVPKSVDVGKAEQVVRNSVDAGHNQLAVQYQQNLETAKQKVLEKNKADYIKNDTYLEKDKTKGQGALVKKRKKRHRGHIDIII